MKKQWTLAFLGCAVVFAGAWFGFVEPAHGQGFAAELQKQTNAFAGSAELGNPRDPRLVAALIIQILLALAGTVFIAYIVYAGYLIAFSAGEEDKINDGKKVLRRSVIALAIILSAYSITLFVARLATGQRPGFDLLNDPDAMIDPNKGVGDTLLDFVDPRTNLEVKERTDNFLCDDPLDC